MYGRLALFSLHRIGGLVELRPVHLALAIDEIYADMD